MPALKSGSWHRTRSFRRCPPITWGGFTHTSRPSLETELHILLLLVANLVTSSDARSPIRSVLVTSKILGRVHLWRHKFLGASPRPQELQKAPGHYEIKQLWSQVKTRSNFGAIIHRQKCGIQKNPLYVQTYVEPLSATSSCRLALLYIVFLRP